MKIASQALRRMAAHAVAVLMLTAGHARAQFQDVFMVGADNGSTGEFEAEHAGLVHYYWEDDDYTALGGENWSGGKEPFLNGTADDATGFPRGLLQPGSANTQTNIYFHLDANEAGANQPLRFTLDLTGLQAGTTHNLDVRLNGTAPFASMTDIGTAQTWTINTTAGIAGAVAGPNVLRVRRTGGTLNGGTASIQFDYLRMQADISPQLISGFTGSDSLLRPGESCVLSWTLFEPGATVSIQPDVGDVTGVTTGGAGSIAVSPTTSTVYTLTATLNGQPQSRTFTVNTSPWAFLFEAGTDNASAAEFSHESAADENYYFAGDYTAAGGPSQAANEILNDDLNTNTPAGRTGNPAVGFARAVTESEPVQNIWFIAPASKTGLTARHRITFDVLSVSAAGGAGTHHLELSLNGKVLRQQTIGSGLLIQFEVTGATSGLAAGPNFLTVKRTGGTVGGVVTFDYAMMEYTPGTPLTITGITDDPVLGTHTIAWTGQTTRTYRVQKSTDAGATWSDLVLGFPEGGAKTTALSWEDRATPPSDPRPDYRVLLE